MITEGLKPGKPHPSDASISRPSCRQEAPSDGKRDEGTRRRSFKSAEVRPTTSFFSIRRMFSVGISFTSDPCLQGATPSGTAEKAGDGRRAEAKSTPKAAAPMPPKAVSPKPPTPKAAAPEKVMPLPGSFLLSGG